MRDPNNPCLFCNVSESGCAHENVLAYASYDTYPVSDHHCFPGGVLALWPPGGARAPAMGSHAATFAIWSIVLLGRHCYFAVLRHHLPGFFQTISVGLKPAPAVPPTEIGRQNVEAPSLCQATMPAFYLFLKCDRIMIVSSPKTALEYVRGSITRKKLKTTTIIPPHAFRWSGLLLLEPL